MSGNDQQHSVARPSLISKRTWPSSKRRGLLIRIDRPINKDTELHPLVRWQFLGGIPGRRSPRVSFHQCCRFARTAL